MTNWQQFIFARLSQTSVGTRVYPNSIRQGAAMPAIVYQEITAGDRGQSTRGGSGIMRSFVQVTCLADRYDQATDLAEEARIILDGYTGAAGGVTVQHCVLQNGSRRDLPTLAGDSEEQTRFGVQMDFNVMYVADVPNP